MPRRALAAAPPPLGVAAALVPPAAVGPFFPPVASTPEDAGCACTGGLLLALVALVALLCPFRIG